MPSIFLILIVFIFHFGFVFLRTVYLKIPISIEPALAQENKEVFNIVIENVLVMVVGIMTAVVALMNISSAINQMTFSKPAYQNFELSMWVSFIGFSALLIFSRVFTEYYGLFLHNAISLNIGIFIVSFLFALINYLYSNRKERGN